MVIGSLVLTVVINLLIVLRR